MVARLSIIACFLTLEIAAREWIVRIKEFQDPATMTTRPVCDSFSSKETEANGTVSQNK
jgi:hypothetical protein